MPVTIFAKVLAMSLTASFVILAVLPVRLLLGRLPKGFCCVLWGIVLLRLLCPAAMPSPLSLVPDSLIGGSPVYGWMDSYVGGITIIHDNSPAYTAAVSGGAEVIPVEEGGHYAVAGESGVAPPATVETELFPILAGVWLIGLGAMAVYAAVSYGLLRRRLLTASLLNKNIYLADGIPSPFVLGLVRPRIYLPSAMAETERDYILLHEQCHIRHLDHIFKALFFAALCIHWFNPLVWVAFVLAGKDMEMRCDEAVVKTLGEEVLADYSASLLSLATGQRVIAGMPLAFGEGDPKGRIRNLIRWKKPALWAVALAVTVCLLLAVCLLTDPAAEEAPPSARCWISAYPDAPSEEQYETTLAEFPGVTFRWDQVRVDAIADGETTTLYSGMPLWDVYFADLTGDGKPEICSNAAFGSGLIDERVLVYDYAAGRLYTIEDRGNFDYRISLEDGILMLTKLRYNTKEVLETKPLALDTLGKLYVPERCVYLNPLSSSTPEYEMASMKYLLGEDWFVRVDPETGEILSLISYLESRDWQPCPYSAAEWEALFFSPIEAPALPENARYLSLSSRLFLLRTDTELWLAELKDLNQSSLYLWSIYALTPER